MPEKVIIDSGPLIALFDKDDCNHQKVTKSCPRDIKIPSINSRNAVAIISPTWYFKAK